MSGEKRIGILVSPRARRVRPLVRGQTAHLSPTIRRSSNQGPIKPKQCGVAQRELAEQRDDSRSLVRATLAASHNAGKLVRTLGHGTLVLAAPTAQHSEVLALMGASSLRRRDDVFNASKNEAGDCVSGCSGRAFAGDRRGICCLV